MNEYNIVSSIPSCVWTNGVAINDRIDSMYYRSSSIKDYQKIKKFSKIKRVSNYFDVSKLSGFEYTDYFTEENLKSGTVIALTSQNVMENQINFDNIIKIPFEIHNSLERSKIYPNDILLSYTGQYRRACTAPQNIELHLGPNICRLRSTKLIDVHYVSTFLNCRYGQSSLDREKTMSAQPTVNMGRIRDILLPIPPPEIQRYIGDKVRKAEELREEAKRLKKEAEEILNTELNLSYFNERVKYAPKMYNWMCGELIEARIDSQYYINETNFINAEMNKKGLKLKKISEVASVGKGFSYTSLDKKSIPYIRISDLDDLLINFDSVEMVDKKTYSEKKSSQLEQYDLIFAITGATIGKVSLFYNNKCSKATLSSDTAFVRLKDKNDAAYVLLYLKSIIGQISILKGITGATNRHLSLEHIGDIFIPVIDNKLKREINIIVIKAIDNMFLSKQLIKEAKQDVEDLIEGNFSMKK
ncbi:Restriction modification system DNA specificity domain protein [Tepidanaerobacter acetatoxydans Re1]|uniref:Restriction modification system DNA specificity domain protein n=1 Tax=Tepidanaerobacter acetatoxydans (strain DSM 21804 / JCM 16047 / Re1) TaxID=1209989 RepID=F4LSP6_TEPAE|nr:restriction endonuclease subunit S [Tepidanaerobacter acetatoxydans]AEE92436.1 restriction modification system DNA specificity domain protein [Tepidanaerobacter acetatoxydans Re1]CDI41009.1 Restriction modification system DNA specificity domain protein [Tepidanaerobacter acetatoxydans Re1]